MCLVDFHRNPVFPPCYLYFLQKPIFYLGEKSLFEDFFRGKHCLYISINISYCIVHCRHFTVNKTKET